MDIKLSHLLYSELKYYVYIQTTVRLNPTPRKKLKETNVCKDMFPVDMIFSLNCPEIGRRKLAIVNYNVYLPH